MKKITTLFVLVFSTFLFSQEKSNEKEGLKFEYDYDYVADYQAIVKSFLLKENFTNPKYLSSFPDMVMIPQEYAFKTGDTIIKKDLHNFYTSMTPCFNEIKSMDVVYFGLHRLSLIKVVSHYLRLIKENKQEQNTDPLEEVLKDFVLSEIQYFFNLNNPGWPPLIDGNVSERIEWGLNNWSSVPKGVNNYAYSINDDIWRLVEASANIFVYLEKSEQLVPDYINKLNELGYNFIREGGVINKEGYLFQPGSISDHPDNLYAGQKKILNPMEKKEVEGLGWDTSHFSLFPSMVYSLQKAFVNDAAKSEYLKICSEYISNVFHDEIVEEIDGFLYTKNYMNGTNGVYRYDEKLRDAYLPYEVSGTILFGHWIYLNSDKNYSFFYKLFDSFPLNNEALRVYQSKFLRNRSYFNSNQIEYLYENPSIKVYSFFCLELSKSVGDNAFKLDVSVYPNPTDNYLLIEGNKNPISISIYDLLGKKVSSAKNTNRVNVKQLSNGVYIIRISDGVGQTVRKFIKN
jgi:hypothetical protein